MLSHSRIMENITFGMTNTIAQCENCSCFKWLKLIIPVSWIQLLHTNILILVFNMFQYPVIVFPYFFILLFLPYTHQLSLCRIADVCLYLYWRPKFLLLASHYFICNCLPTVFYCFMIRNGNEKGIYLTIYYLWIKL